jgi:hypothetical protein
MKHYIRNNSSISGRISNELVIMDIGKGKYFSLTHVATRIWELLEKPLTPDELCVRLQEEYDVDPGRCRTEVEKYLGDMLNLGLVLEESEGRRDKIE